MFLVGIMSVVIVVQVLCRTFLGFSIFWSEEFARYCLIWITFVGTSMAIRKAELAVFDLVLESTPIKWKWIYRLILDGLVLTFICIAIYFGFKQTFAPSALAQVSPALRSPMWVVYLSVPVGFIMMFIHIMNSMVQTVMNRKEGEKEWQSS